MPSNEIWAHRNRYVLASREAPEHNTYLQGLKLLCRPIFQRSPTMTCRFCIDKPLASTATRFALVSDTGDQTPR